MAQRRVRTRQTRFKTVYRQPYQRRPPQKFVGTKTAVVVGPTRKRQVWIT